MINKQKYNPNIHHRKSIRLKRYDYAQVGLYFITICCQDRICRFGNIKNGAMNLNELGEIAHHHWTILPERFSNFELDVFQIMPNHIHGIISLHDVGATLAVAPNESTVAPNESTVAPNESTVAPNESTDFQNDADNHKNAMMISQDDRWLNRAGASPAPTATAAVSDMVGAYKSLVANACLNIFKSKNEIMGKLWQRNYYEHIIRNETSYYTIREYIVNNPVKWDEDKFFIKPNCKAHLF